MYYVSLPDSKIKRLFAYIESVNSKLNPCCRYGNTITKYIRKHILFQAEKLKEEGYNPDVIILEWTEMVLLIDLVKKIFPSATIVCSEHDVKYQSLERKNNAEENFFMKIIRNIRLKTIKKYELMSLRRSDLIVVQSGKDKNLLIDAGIENSKVHVISPFYMKSEKRWVDNNNDSIVIYGDMSREENYESAIWFIENVFKKITNQNIKLIVLGGNPPDKLRAYSDDRIDVTGFVDDIFEYLDRSYCMVVPLQLGAGIKVKCLEALSYGIPLVTNDIGIEGIGATEGLDYILCNSSKEFCDAVIDLKDNKDLRLSLSKNALEYSERYLNIENSYQEYKEKLGV